MIPDSLDRPEPAAAKPISPAKTEWMTAAWFLLGILVGVVGMTVFNALTAKPALDEVAVRAALFEAAATLQAGAPESVNPVSGASSLDATSPTPAAPSTLPASFNLRAANRIGNENAPVTIVEFSDFQCPYCRRSFDLVEPSLIKDYVETGKASFAYKHLAFLGPESVWAAQASECAADQSRFWDYHDLLFNRQSGENRGTFTKENLLSFAAELNLDMARFEPCLQNDETLARVQADIAEGQQAGVRGTPTFFINGEALAGAQPYAQFQFVLERMLAEVK